MDTKYLSMDPLNVRSTVEALADRLREEVYEDAGSGASHSAGRDFGALRRQPQPPARGATPARSRRHDRVPYQPRRRRGLGRREGRPRRAPLRRNSRNGGDGSALPHIDAGELAALRKADAALRAEKGGRAFFDAHHDFHQRIYEACGNALLVKTIHNHYVKIARVPASERVAKALAASIKTDHALLLDAIERRDLRAARKATREHLDHLEAIVLAALGARE